jgi:hypothetical protein
MKLTDEEIQKVWEKAHAIIFFNPDDFRKDDYDIWIERKFFGDHESGFGWEAEKIDPKKGNDVSNLKPVHWRNKK